MEQTSSTKISPKELKDMMEKIGSVAAGFKVFNDGVQCVNNASYWQYITQSYKGGQFFNSIEAIANYSKTHPTSVETVLRYQGFQWEVFNKYRPSLLNINELPGFTGTNIAVNAPGKDVISSNLLTGKKVFIECKTGITSNTILQGAKRLFEYPPDRYFAVNESIYNKALELGMPKERFIFIMRDEELINIGEERFKQLAQNEAFAGLHTMGVLNEAFKGAVIGAIIGVGLSTISNYKQYVNGQISEEQFAKIILKDSAKSSIMGGSFAIINIAVQYSAKTLGVAYPVTIPVMIVVGMGLNKIIAPMFKEGTYAKILSDLQFYEDIAKGWMNFANLSSQLFYTQEIFIDKLKQEIQDFKKIDQISKNVDKKIIEELLTHGEIMKEQTKLSLKNIDKIVGGKRFQSKDIDELEYTLAAFVEETKEDPVMLQERIGDITQLLEVTSKNLEQIKNQKWFQRSWHTITGKNKHLKSVNEENLLQVQKAIPWFLEKLASQNTVIMQSVLLALRRAKIAQIESEKLKMFLLMVKQQLNSRLENIEDSIEKISFFSRIRARMSLRRYRRIVNKNNKIIAKIRDTVRKNYVSILDKALLEHIMYIIVDSLNELKEIDAFFKKYSGKKIDTEEIIEKMEESLNICLPDKDSLCIAIECVVTKFISYHNNSIVDNLLTPHLYISSTDSISLDTKIDMFQKEKWCADILSSLKKYFTLKKEIAVCSEEALSFFPEYSEIIGRKEWMEISKWGAGGVILGYLVGGIGVGIIGFFSFLRGRKDKIVIKNFTSAYDKYINKIGQLEKFINTLDNMFIPIKEEMINLSMCKLVAILEEFNNKSILINSKLLLNQFSSNQ
ncbi:hypothetical protein M0P98_01035 [bacterium]|nr:hypothetical protein [bacterium]